MHNDRKDLTPWSIDFDRLAQEQVSAIQRAFGLACIALALIFVQALVGWIDGAASSERASPPTAPRRAGAALWAAPVAGGLPAAVFGGLPDVSVFGGLK